MKRLLLALFSLAATYAVQAQGTDDFSTLQAHTGYLSDTTAAGWITQNAAVLTGGAADNNPVFTGIGADDQTKAVCINGKLSAIGSITSPVITGGIGTLTFNYGHFFSEANGIDFTISVTRGEQVLSQLQVLKADPEKGVAYQYSAPVNIDGDVQLVFTNNSPSQSSSNKDRYAIWNVSWTASDGSGDQPIILPDAPVITPATGTYSEPQTISITAAEGCTIFYTLDGTTPDEYSEIYTAPFTISRTTTVRAIAVDAAGLTSYMSTSTITIVQSIANTIETAYTTAEAIALIDNPSSNLKDTVYVKGVVSNVDNYNATYHNLTYWLDDKTFEVYAGFGLDGVDPENDTYLAAGDTVIVCGQIKKYGSIYEMDKNNIIVSLCKYQGPAIDDDIRNTPETAYTIARTIELIDAGQGLDNKVYVRGTISQIDEVSLQYGNASYYITDGTTEVPFQIYRGYFLQGQKFTSEDQIKVGDDVIVYGKIKKYYEKYEMDSGNQIYSLNGEEEDAAIQSVFTDLSAPATIYNVQGQRIGHIQQQGIYIIQGQKVIIR